MAQLSQASRRAAMHGRWLVDSLDEVRQHWLQTIPARGGSAGILVATTDRKRDRIFLARDVIDVLDDFASLAGRRDWQDK